MVTGGGHVVDQRDQIDHRLARAGTTVGQLEPVAPHLLKTESVVGCTVGLVCAAGQGVEGHSDLSPTVLGVRERRFPPLGSVRTLVNADVVDQHARRRLQIIADRAAEVATDRHVEQQEDRVVEHPLVAVPRRPGWPEW